MIEKLMNPERPYGEPAYSELSKHIRELQCTISAQLPPQSQAQLEQLDDAYMRRETAVLSDAFTDGFWTGLELLTEFYQRNRT